jgi:hypothetical protein
MRCRRADRRALRPPYLSLPQLRPFTIPTGVVQSESGYVSAPKSNIRAESPNILTASHRVARPSSPCWVLCVRQDARYQVCLLQPHSRSLPVLSFHPHSIFHKTVFDIQQFVQSGFARQSFPTHRMCFIFKHKVPVGTVRTFPAAQRHGQQRERRHYCCKYTYGSKRHVGNSWKDSPMANSCARFTVRS